MSEYKAEPGRFYKATVRGVPDTVVAKGNEKYWLTGRSVCGWATHDDERVTDIRPLVVLDLDDRKKMLSTLRAARNRIGMGSDIDRLNSLIDQIEAQTKPPKPPEPTGLGAVVEDAADQEWVWGGDETQGGEHLFQRAHGPGPCLKTYSQLDAVQVLSEGVPS